jgi:hypothetical protein
VIINYTYILHMTSNILNYSTPSVLRSRPSSDSRGDSSGLFDWRFALSSMEFQWKAKRIKENWRKIGRIYCCFPSYSSVFRLFFSSLYYRVEWHSRGLRFDPAYLHQKQGRNFGFCLVFLTFWGKTSNGNRLQWNINGISRTGRLKKRSLLK